MYFPFIRGRQYELQALQELVTHDCISDRLIPIIEPMKPIEPLYNMIEAFVKKNKKLCILINPEIGNFYTDLQLAVRSNSKVGINIEKILEHENIYNGYIMNADIAETLKSKTDLEQYIIVNKNRDTLDSFIEVYDNILPKYIFMGNDKLCRKFISNNKVLLDDKFHKQTRNIDYLKNDDEFFSDDHLTYSEEDFVGFSDYSIVGEEYNVSGFAPLAVAIHLVYFDDNKDLRIHHFISDSNDGIQNPGGEFGEALEKLVKWCDSKKIEHTLGLDQLYDCYKTGRYPGLGVVKKYSIMHHLELMSKFLEGEI